jgi:hypothetical protein
MRRRKDFGLVERADSWEITGRQPFRRGGRKNMSVRRRTKLYWGDVDNNSLVEQSAHVARPVSMRAAKRRFRVLSTNA